MPTYIGTDGDDLLTGSTFNDTIVGRGGDDLIDDGGGGADELNGGSGNDQYLVRDFRGSVVEFANGGYDIVNTNLLRYILPANVERLVYVSTGDFSGAGNALDNVIDGGGGSDLLSGAEGADILRGGGGPDLLDGGSGLDTLFGGSGDDRYYVDAMGDSLYEQAGDGLDTVIASATVVRFTLPTEVERLVYVGTVAFAGTGNASDNLLIGGTGDDVLSGEVGRDDLYGSGGNDLLLGGMGAANTLVGGSGDDRYYVDAAGDSVIEAAGEGADRVLTTLSGYTLPSNVEDVYYRGAGTFSGFGNNLRNTIAGGDGADALYDFGPDTLIGGNGDDSYFVSNNNSFDPTTIVESSGGGNDTVYGYGGFTLPTNVENYSFVSREVFEAGVTGNASNNVLVGATNVVVGPNGPRGGVSLSGLGGNDTLVGGRAADRLAGGAGNDELIGSSGDDLYIGVDLGDSIVELANEGTDRVETALARYTLLENLENLEYTGSATFKGVGNAVRNLIIGGDNADALSGMDGDDLLVGRRGADSLTGGNGRDVFYYVRDDFFVTSVPTGLDRILDFTSGADTVTLQGGAFARTATVDYVAGTTPTSTNSTFLYDSATGIVRYDPDGTGSTAAFEIAQLNPGLTLTGADFTFANLPAL